MHICDKCKKEFTKKSSYVKHMNRKTSCIKEENIMQKEKDRTCQYCNKIFTQPYILRYHLNKCKQVPTEIESLEKIMFQLNQTLNDKIDKQLIDLKNEIYKNKQKPNKTEICDTDSDKKIKTKIGYVYLLKNFDIKNECFIYKIGRTKRKLYERLNEYAKGITTLNTSYVDNCELAEKFISNKFKNDEQINKADNSNEWFYCNNEKYIINQFISSYLNYDK